MGQGPLARLGLSLLSAALLFASVPAFGVALLMWVALVPALIVALEAPTAKRAFLHGWLTGFVANAAAFSWMDGLLERFGHMPMIEALPIIGLLVGYQGLAFGFFSWGVRRLHGQSGTPVIVLAPLVMVVIELCIPQVFPYYLAISQSFHPVVIQIADVTGPLGVTALLLVVNGAVVDLIRRRHAGWKRAATPLAIAAALVLADLVYGAARMRQADVRRASALKVRTGIVQANVGVLEKWDPRAFAHLLALHQRQSAALAAAGAELIVWPESSYPYPLPKELGFELPDADPRRIRRGFDTPLVFGAVTQTPANQYPYNTALMLDGAGQITGTYDKVFLMLFGEYIPFYDAIPWFTKIFPEASNFSRGKDPGSFPLEVRGHHLKLGPLICYEDILPGFVRRVARLDPNAFVNITNDAWFGRTAEPYQHLALAVFRSVENRLEMVRSVNTGVSAHIDSAGRVLAQTFSADPDQQPAQPPATLNVDLAMLEAGGLYRYVGDLFGFLCLAVVVVLAVRPRARKKTASESV